MEQAEQRSPRKGLSRQYAVACISGQPSMSSTVPLSTPLEISRSTIPSDRRSSSATTKGPAGRCSSKWPAISGGEAEWQPRHPVRFGTYPIEQFPSREDAANLDTFPLETRDRPHDGATFYPAVFPPQPPLSLEDPLWCKRMLEGMQHRMNILNREYEHAKQDTSAALMETLLAQIELDGEVGANGLGFLLCSTEEEWRMMQRDKKMDGTHGLLVFLSTLMGIDNVRRIIKKAIFVARRRGDREDASTSGASHVTDESPRADSLDIDDDFGLENDYGHLEAPDDVLCLTRRRHSSPSECSNVGRRSDGGHTRQRSSNDDSNSSNDPGDRSLDQLALALVSLSKPLKHKCGASEHDEHANGELAGDEDGLRTPKRPRN